MRMVQRDADFGAAIFEQQHIGNARARTELLRAFAPDLEQQLDMAQRQDAQRGFWVLREHHHFAMPGSRRGGYDQLRWRRRAGQHFGQGRKAVVEDRHIPGTGRYFSGVGRVSGHRQRVVLGWWQECAVLAVGGISDPLAPQRVPAQVRCGVQRLGKW